MIFLPKSSSDYRCWSITGAVGSETKSYLPCTYLPKTNKNYIEEIVLEDLCAAISC